MIGERENTYSDTNYGTLVMRPYNIDGNEIHAFYDAQNDLVFVLDNTITAQKPNVLLVINPDGDKKWDEILSGKYNVDLETIRPKVDNKYQKLDIEYSGLSVYENLISAYNDGDGLDEHLNQLAILRDSAVRHSAMTRLNAANETISKTNTTIVKTKEAIVRLEARIKTLRSKLSTAKKEIGKVNTKQSASKILKLESQIEAAQEKLKRAKKRLESAQKRLETATVDAELASDLLNQPSTEIKEIEKSKPVVVVPDYPVQTVDEEKETEIQPLFSEDPQILDDDIAFKPISFEAPVFDMEIEEKPDDVPSVSVPELTETENRPVLESLTPVVPVEEEKTEIIEEEKPVIETIKPVADVTETEEVDFVPPVIQSPAPVAPVVNSFEAPVEAKEERTKPGFIYYILLLVLILLSVFTLWLYQRNMSVDTRPVLTAKTQETTVVEEPQKAPKTDVTAVVEEDEEESAFLDEEPAKPEVVVKPVIKPEPVVVEPEVKEDIIEELEPEPEEIEEFVVEEDEVPVVIDAVPGRLNTSVNTEEENYIESEEDILAKKPIYEPGAKHDEMFVNTDNEADEILPYDEDELEYIDDEEIYY